MGFKITICTPTYNRGHLLKRLYDSLKKQSFNNFEWLVIDDGSTDNTKDIIESFIKEKFIQIKYINKLNGGKHTAINVAIENACSELFFIVDSDDMLVPNALYEVCECWEGIENKSEFAGVSGLRGFNEDKIIGNTFNQNYLDCDAIELRYKYKIQGDKAEVYRTDILKDNLFPVFKGEKFITEALVWNRIAKKGLKVRWFNKIIYITEYLDGGLTDNYDKLMIKNWRGTTLYYKELLSYNKISSYKKFISIYPEYINYCSKMGLGVSELNNLTSNQFKISLIKVIYSLKKILKQIKEKKYE